MPKLEVLEVQSVDRLSLDPETHHRTSAPHNVSGRLVSSLQTYMSFFCRSCKTSFVGASFWKMSEACHQLLELAKASNFLEEASNHHANAINISKVHDLDTDMPTVLAGPTGPLSGAKTQTLVVG